MTEIIEESKSAKVYLKTNIEDDIYNSDNIYKINTDYSNSIPSHDAFSM